MAPSDDSLHDLENAPTMLGTRPIGNEEMTMVDPGPSEVTAIAPVSFDQQLTHEEIAAEAYALYEARGADHGGHESDWLEAERRLKARRQ